MDKAMVRGGDGVAIVEW